MYTDVTYLAARPALLLLYVLAGLRMWDLPEETFLFWTLLDTPEARAACGFFVPAADMPGWLAHEIPQHTPATDLCLLMSMPP